MPFINPDDLPEEIRDHINKQEMHNTSAAHEMTNFIKSLNEEQLIALRMLVQHMSNDVGYGGLVTGIIISQLESRFGLCLACGAKHDEELADIANQDSHLDNGVSSSYTERCMHYNVSLIHGKKVQCNNCGQVYPSLEDRELRAADKSGCSGCIQKEKWG